MDERTVHIPNINCRHCVMTIQRELGAVDGIVSVDGDVDEQTVSVTWREPATWDGVVELLKEINYPPAGG